MDAIRLNLEAKDQLFPLISDILSTLNRYDNLFVIGSQHNSCKHSTAGALCCRQGLSQRRSFRRGMWHLLPLTVVIYVFTAEESSLRIVTLHAMRASDALTPEQLRQLSFDLETGYSEFQAVLAGRK